jgi:ribulose-5-phosphate 4-epimerase/fuculose-1-phosphate aldolase
MSDQSAAARSAEPIGASEAEWALRQDLAAAFRLLDKYGMSDLTNGSIVGRLGEEPDWFLTHPHGLFFHEIRASDLIKVDLDGRVIGGEDVPTNYAVCKPAAAIFRARPDVNAVIHAHGQGVMAVAALECGLLPISEAAFPFYNDLAYIDADFYFEDSYCAEIARALGPHKAMIYRHHAFAAVGGDVPEAFYFAFQLNVACELQLKILAANQKVLIPPPVVCQRHYDACFGSDWRADGSVEWPGLRRILDAEDPSYAT